MSGLDLGRLREIAEAATVGPWEIVPIGQRCDVRGLPENTSYDSRGDAVATAADSEFGAMKPYDAEHVATFDPPTVLALLDLAARGEALGSRLRMLHAKYAERSTWVGFEQPRREAWREIAGDLKPLLVLLNAAETTGETPPQACEVARGGDFGGAVDQGADDEKLGDV